MRGRHARPPAWTPAAEATRKAAPAVVVAGMVLTAQHPAPPEITTPTTPNVPGVPHADTIPGTWGPSLPQRARPGLAYVALARLAAAPKAATLDSATIYTVQPGDCLWTIAQQFYGHGDDWTRIYDANLAIIGGTPGLIKPGQHLVIPGASTSAPRPATSAASPTPSSAPATPASSSETAWIASFLGALGAPNSPQNQATMTQWIAQEQPWSQAEQSWNPLNTMESGFGSTSTFGIGISIYPTAEDGLQATLAAIHNGDYPAIITALKNSQSMASYGPWSSDLSTWSGGGYSTIAPGNP